MIRKNLSNHVLRVFSICVIALLTIGGTLTAIAAAPVGTMTASPMAMRGTETKTINAITITDSGGEINGTSDIAIRIPSAFTNTDWSSDFSSVSYNVSGNTSGTMSSPATIILHPTDNNIVILQVASTFTSGDRVIISGLKIVTSGESTVAATPLDWGVDAIPPTVQNWSATSGATLEVDVTPPTVTNVYSVDADGDGDVDALDVQFSEPILDSSINLSEIEFDNDTTNDGTGEEVATGGSTNVTYPAPASVANDDYYRFTVPNGISGTELANLHITGTSLTDISGNAIVAANNVGTDFDRAAPVALSGGYLDTGSTGTIDQVNMGFSENVTYTFNNGDWTETANGLSGFDVNACTSCTSTSSIQLTASADANLTGALGGTQPSLQFTPGNNIADSAGNNAAGFTLAALTDGANPVIYDRVTDDSDSNGKIDTIIFIATEELTDNFGDIAVTVTGYTVTGYVTGTFGNDEEFEASITEIGGTCDASDQTGCDTNATPNTQITINTLLLSANGETIPTDAGTVASTDEAPAAMLGGAYVDNNFDGTIDGAGIMFSENVTYTYQDADWVAVANNLTSFDVTGCTATCTNENPLQLTATAAADITGVNAGTEPSLSYTAGNNIADQSAAANASSNFAGLSLTDMASPALIDLGYYDSGLDGQVDTVELEFSEYITLTSYADADWAIGAGTIGLANETGSSVQGGNGTSQYLDLFTLGSANITGGVTAPTVTYTDNTNLNDGKGNDVAGFGPTNVNDWAEPFLLSFTSSTADATYGPGSAINLTANFTETIASGVVTVGLDTGVSKTLNMALGTTISTNYTVGLTGSGENTTDLTVSNITFNSANDGNGNIASSTAMPATNIAAGSDIVVDTTADAAPGTPDLQTASDSGTSNSDNITNDNTPTFDISCVTGSTVTLRINTVDDNTGVCAGGTVTIIASLIPDSSVAIDAYQTDLVGNNSTDSADLGVTIDTTNPVTTITSAPTPTNGTQAITFTATDTGGSGVNTTECSTDGATFAACASNDLYSSLNGWVGLAEGAFTLTVRTTDNVGLTHDDTAAVTKDTVAPAAPAAPDMQAGSDTGASSTDNLTNDNTPTFDVIASDGASTMELFSSSDGSVGTRTGSGAITTTALTSTGLNMTLVETDAAGNASPASAPLGISVDTTAPTLAETTPVTDPTNDQTPDVSFSSDEAGAMGWAGGCQSTTTTATAATQTITLDSDGAGGNLAEATYNCILTVTDNAGNASAGLGLTAFTVDVSNPTGTATAGTATLYEGDLIQEILITYDEPMDPLSTPTINFAGTTGAFTSNADGVWATALTWTETFTIADANEEVVGATVNSSGATDFSANVEGVPVGDTFDVDTLAPTLTTATIASSNATDATKAGVGDTVTLSITGSETINQPVVAFTSGAAAVADTPSTYFPAWTAAYTANVADTEGVVAYTIDFSDTIGNNGIQVTTTTDASSVDYDNSAPVVTTYVAADDAAGVAISGNLDLTFDDDVVVGTGNVVIYKASDDSVFETIDITTANVTFDGTTGVSINPTANFAYSTAYYVQVDATAIENTVGLAYAGIADKTTWNFTTAAAPPPPASSGGSAGGRVSPPPTPTEEDPEAYEAPLVFSDVLGHWAEDYIYEAKDAGYVEGYEDETFKPDQYITRSEAAKLIASWLDASIGDDACNADLFSDVDCSVWYAKYVTYLSNTGIIEGYGDGTFGPGNYINRAEALKMMLFAKTLQDSEIADIVNPFSDVNMEQWFYNNVMIGYKLSIIQGYDDGTFGPGNNITRAEFTKIFIETLINN